MMRMWRKQIDGPNGSAFERSELLREALASHLGRLAAEADADAYEAQPFTPDELALDDADEWGPSEDWSDWRHGQIGGTVQRGESLVCCRSRRRGSPRAPFSHATPLPTESTESWWAA